MESTPDERRKFILAELQSKGRLSTADLAERFSLSEDTARRDFRELAADGMIKRVHGAALPVTPGEQPFQGRYKIARDVKTKLARIAAEIVLPDQIIMIDGGTTNLELAKHLPLDLRATVITNSPTIATATAEHRNLEVILLGGVFDKRSQMTLGARVLEQIHALSADICFIGVHGLHEEYGLTTAGYDEASVKGAMLQVSAEVVAIATPDKIGTVGAYKFAPLSAVDVLVTDRSARNSPTLEKVSAKVLTD
ncbi:DeoR/GlpR family DNA-binding transcription regulator [Shinella zoogloeoides]|uniref:DeoR/GlpR family DNA-binding transcription regulator n=1 Tax=Shinella zoogloeoides TaxID=352475 RepID=UPI0013C2D1CE|nr:DeoR/GlpR family DNA-binding transcription regulator [Shinella zoogloeoides]